jgi:hypothetical protein
VKLEKLGRVFVSSGQHPWMVSHAQVPVAEHVHDDVFRIYFTSRDVKNRSHITWLEADINEPQRIARLADKPLLGPGTVGAFDDCGAMTSWILPFSGLRYFYYIGWNIRTTVSFQNAIGLATGPVSEDPPVIERYSPGPILDRNTTDHFFCANPCVIIDGNSWKMWYLSGIGWENLNGKPEPLYNIRYAESSDGKCWRRDGLVCIDLKQPDELAIARPCVIKDPDCYRMWYCYRGRSSSYLIGYAESADGRSWARMDHEAGIEVSGTGWDSEMIAYPYVFDHHGKRYMLYCGNGYSREGFGLAVFV